MTSDNGNSDAAVQAAEEEGRGEGGAAMRPAFMVYTRTTGEGVQVGYEPVEGFEPLAAPTVLELAAKAARLHVGLGS